MQEASYGARVIVTLLYGVPVIVPPLYHVRVIIWCKSYCNASVWCTNVPVIVTPLYHVRVIIWCKSYCNATVWCASYCTTTVPCKSYCNLGEVMPYKLQTARVISGYCTAYWLPTLASNLATYAWLCINLETESLYCVSVSACWILMFIATKNCLWSELWWITSIEISCNRVIIKRYE